MHMEIASYLLDTSFGTESMGIVTELWDTYL